MQQLTKNLIPVFWQLNLLFYYYFMLFKIKKKGDQGRAHYAQALMNLLHWEVELNKHACIQPSIPKQVDTIVCRGNYRYTRASCIRVCRQILLFRYCRLSSHSPHFIKALLLYLYLTETKVNFGPVEFVACSQPNNKQNNLYFLINYSISFVWWF